MPPDPVPTEPPRDIWFPAKRYGWGWGPPVRWQGWVVLLVWSACVAAGAPYLLFRSMLLYLTFLAVMVAILIAVCWAKGERPRWRWGDSA